MEFGRRSLEVLTPQSSRQRVRIWWRTTIAANRNYPLCSDDVALYDTTKNLVIARLLTGQQSPCGFTSKGCVVLCDGNEVDSLESPYTSKPKRVFSLDRGVASASFTFEKGQFPEPHRNPYAGLGMALFSAGRQSRRRSTSRRRNWNGRRPGFGAAGHRLSVERLCILRD